jgi:hypothetical protein
MNNRILDVRIENRSLDPLSAELWITVRPERYTSTTEVRGKLLGPSCPYASTVELAYPLLPLRRPDAESTDEIVCRVVIP